MPSGSVIVESAMPPSSSSRADGVSGGIIAILAMLAAFAPITSDMYLSGFPLMEDYFGVPKGGVEITLSTFFFGLAVGQAVYGPLIDRFGRRLPLLGGITLYVVATLLCLGVTDTASSPAPAFCRLSEAVPA